MKRLILIRHAKSDWGFNVADFDRPLNPRGHKNAPEMVSRLVAKNIFTELIVASSAKRAQTTAQYFLSGWEMSANQLVFDENIYEASTSTLLKIINQFDDRFHTITLVGHNPGMTSIVNYLTSESIVNLPTCSVAVIDFNFDEWALLSAGTGKMFLLDFPKNGLD